MKKSLAVILLGSALVLPNASQAQASVKDASHTESVASKVSMEGNVHNFSMKLHQIEDKSSYKALYRWLQNYSGKTPEKPAEKPEAVEPEKPAPDVPVQPEEKPSTDSEQKPESAPGTEQKPEETPVPTPPAQPSPVPEEEQKPEQPSAEQGTASASQIEQAVLKLTNAERQKAGLQPLKMDEKLMNSARQKSADMAAHNYFSHTSPTYGSPFDQMKANGITYRAAAENIAMGQRSAEEVVTGWMNSPGHRQNILTQGFTHIGIGYDANGHYWTQQFIQK